MKPKKQKTPQGTTLNLTSPKAAESSQPDAGENLLNSHLPETKSRRPRFLHRVAREAVRGKGQIKPKQ